MAKIEIPLKKDYAGAFKYWVDTNTENGVCTIPEYICKGIVGMLGKQPVATDTNVGDTVSRQQALDAINHICPIDTDCDGTLLDRVDVRYVLSDLPSAQPETAKRIVGKSRDGMTLWYQCDMCYEPVDEQDNYCRGCGRRLIDG